MSRLFKLETVGGYQSICPSSGEELGGILARLAAEEMERCIASPTSRVAYWGDNVAQLFYLAADAYEAGSSVTIGHNRSARYDEAAKKHRSMADTLTQQAKLFRDEAEGKILLDAFLMGYDGAKHKNNYCFNRREAFQVGEMFKTLGHSKPTKVRYEYVNRVGRVIVDDQGYLVQYPSGKVNEPIIIPVD